MCTLTYIPLNQGKVVFTQNRDESPKRSAIGIREEAGKLFPKDPKGGGTWMCCGRGRRVVCLLNGAFVKHKRQTPYRKSRGLVVLEFFDYPTADAFFEEYDFNGIEPFTLVAFAEEQLRELRWDGVSKYLKEYSTTQNHIWSSSTLYNEEAKALRRSWFSEWQEQQPFTTEEDILEFHKTAGNTDKVNGLIMTRMNGIVKTVSISQIILKEDSVKVSYEDLLHGENAQIKELVN